MKSSPLPRYHWQRNTGVLPGALQQPDGRQQRAYDIVRLLDTDSFNTAFVPKRSSITPRAGTTRRCYQALS